MTTAIIKTVNAAGLAEGNDAAIELRSADGVHGRTQTFTISGAGIDSQEFDVWGAWLDGEDEVQQFLVPKIGGNLAELAASALGVDVSPELNMRRA